MSAAQQQWDTCPECGQRKTVAARRCAACNRKRPMPKGGRAADGGPSRSIDSVRQARVDWRPPHMAPACATCRGFGYVQHVPGSVHPVGGLRASKSRRGYRVSDEGTAAGGLRVRLAIRLGDRNGEDGHALWHRCPDCVEHPGSACSHAEWAERQR